MLMYVCTTCPSHEHARAWDRRLLHYVVGTSFQHPYPDIFLISGPRDDCHSC